MIYLESMSTEPYYNLATEQFVFDELPASDEYFMLWQNDNSIIVGKYQNTIEEINAPYVEEHGIRVARRLSGGGAVYHDLGNLNYTLICDAGSDVSINMARFCVPVVKALASIGVKAEISGRNDMTIDGLKFSGNSQYVKRGRVMHHGTLMFDSDLEVVSNALHVSQDKILSKGVRSVRSRVTNIREHLPHDMDLSEFKDALVRSMSSENGLTRREFTESDRAAIQKLRDEKYSTWEWNYGSSPAYNVRKERRIDGCGIVQISMDVKKGVISGASISGDFFGSGEISDVEQRLKGCRVERSALEKELDGLDTDYYLKNLTRNQLIDVILQ
ncbi:MAG: lipoate--protein ligase [Eubacterium sp.]|jgi:lipoate-protein ligase A